MAAAEEFFTAAVSAAVVSVEEDLAEEGEADFPAAVEVSAAAVLPAVGSPPHCVGFRL